MKSVAEREKILLKHYHRKIRRGALSKEDPNYEYVETLANGLGQLMVLGSAIETAREKARGLIASVESESASLRDFYELSDVDGLTVLSIISLSTEKAHEKARQLLAVGASNLGKKGAAARHKGDEEKRKQIQQIWAKGQFATRILCAEQECDALGISLETARKALRNTPSPEPWPAKSKTPKR